MTTPATTPHILLLIDLVRQMAVWHLKSERVVFTNGVFDLLHPGHVAYLNEAAALGDRLVVGVNSDASVKRLGKGDDRPINPQADRAAVLAALRCVDAVVVFEEDTPLQLIEAITPDVLVKGGDWKPDAIVGAAHVKAHGGEVRALGFVEGLSTTGILQRIRSFG